MGCEPEGLRLGDILESRDLSFPIKLTGGSWHHLHALGKYKRAEKPTHCQSYLGCNCLADTPYVILGFLVWLCGHCGKIAAEHGAKRLEWNWKLAQEMHATGT